MTHKSHRHILTLIAAALCLMLAACHHNSPYRATLDAADSLMESRPDSALSLLRAIPSEQITDRATRARHAMLHAMARDKNYIDDTTFTILQPAIDYYENHGTPTEKLRTFYYQGRIYENKQAYDKALEAFQQGLSEGLESNDFPTKGRIHYSQMSIEDFMLQFNEAKEDCKKAAHYFKQANKIDSYAHCLMSLANIYSLMNKNDSAFNYLLQCRSILSTLSSNMQYEFYAFYLSAISPSCDKDSIRKILQEYQHHIPASHWDYLSLADAYSKTGKYDEALDLLSHLNLDNSSLRDQLRYYALKTRIYENKEMYTNAYHAMKHFYAIDDSIEMTHNTKGTRNIKPKHKLEQQVKHVKQSKAQAILTAVACIIALAGWTVVLHYRLKTWRQRKKEADKNAEDWHRKTVEIKKDIQRYRTLYHQLNEETETLRLALRESRALNHTAKTLMAQRLALLNELIADQRGKHKPAQNAFIDMLANPQTFIQSTRQTLSITHPRFIRTLQEHGLTDNEIGFCCLYALGLNTKQAGLYIKTARAYHANSAIRQKLGLDPHETNLNLYITKMLQREEEKHDTPPIEIHT